MCFYINPSFQFILSWSVTINFYFFSSFYIYKYHFHFIFYQIFLNYPLKKISSTTLSIFHIETIFLSTSLSIFLIDNKAYQLFFFFIHQIKGFIYLFIYFTLSLSVTICFSLFLFLIKIFSQPLFIILIPPLIRNPTSSPYEILYLMKFFKVYIFFIFLGVRALNYPLASPLSHPNF